MFQNAEQIEADDFECVLCCRTLWRPVTTPCGHTYCAACLDRSLDYSPNCPLCMTSLTQVGLPVVLVYSLLLSRLTSLAPLLVLFCVHWTQYEFWINLLNRHRCFCHYYDSNWLAYILSYYKVRNQSRYNWVV